MTEESRKEKRQSLNLLMRGIKENWDLPDTAMQTAIDTFVWAMQSSGVSTRDKLRAAESIHLIAARREERLLELAKFEESLIATDAKIEHEQAMNEVFPDIVSMMKQERDKQAQSKK